MVLLKSEIVVAIQLGIDDGEANEENGVQPTSSVRYTPP